MKRKLFSTLIERLTEKEAVVVTGMRRVGKTFLLRQVFDTIHSSNKLFLDLENPISQKYFEKENYEEIKYQLELLGIDSGQQAYIFLDEIQFVKNIPSVVKYLMDHYPFKFFLTGSASFYLKNLFSESLAGRKVIYELFPLSFEEFLELKDTRIRIPRGRITRIIYETIIPLYREYIDFGAFPAVITKSGSVLKKEALEDIFSSYFNKEVIAIGGFRNNKIIRDLILLLAERVGCKLEVSRLATELGTTRVTIEEYLSFLEGTYFIKLVAPYTTSRDVEIRSAKKVYFCDSGLLKNMSAVSFGSLLENTVFSQLRQRGVDYYQKKSGAEIDFIVGKKSGYEVKTTANKHDFIELERLANDIGLSENHIVSYNWVDFPVTFGFQL